MYNVLFVVLFVCVAYSFKQPFPYLEKPYIIAHRGSRVLAPEATIMAFETALSLGAHVLEFDVRITSDNVLVVFHDELLDRTTDASGSVRSRSYDQLQLMDAAHKFTPINNPGQSPHRGSGIKIPSLSQVLQHFWGAKPSKITSDRKAVNFNIEIKDKDSLAVTKLIEEFEKYRTSDWVKAGFKVDNHILVCSKYGSVMDELGKKSTIPTCASETDCMKILIPSLILTSYPVLTPIHHMFSREEPRFCAYSIPSRFSKLDFSNIDFMRTMRSQTDRNDLQIHYWVVNDSEGIQNLIEIGADAIITDRTDVAVKVFKRMNVYKEVQLEDWTRSMKGIADKVRSDQLTYGDDVQDLVSIHLCNSPVCYVIENFQLLLVGVIVMSFVCFYQLCYCCYYPIGNTINKIKKD
ncbi:glycerophosphoryl diester phosphodiesterase glpQ [Acrasis kona]|uniref:Glycerophosphoryl diester phosphodiesterase glpQ n=1 Tax=Acrasis kona TaxID=1008807 RepID=A0AAW2YL50_9EUKA